MIRARPALAVPTLLVCATLGTATLPQSDADREARLGAMQEEIERLQSEVDSLRGRERGVLGEIERLGAETRLREAEVAEVGLRIAVMDEAVAARENGLERLEIEQGRREGYLAFRLRELHKRGRDAPLRILLRREEPSSYFRGLEDAGYLAERDARTLRAYRESRARLENEQAALSRQRTTLDRTRAAAEQARGRATVAREERQGLLARIRQDREARELALRELEQASEDLGRLVHGLVPPADLPRLDARSFRGLLPWPAEGRVSQGFGQAVHPRFGTVVPHTGLDIEAAEGSPFHCVFDGRVAFASRLRGYGLTVIVEHGHGVVSVYAHASILVVGEGERVSGGQALGRVGETGSLRGPYLYFEIRENGRPVDPLGWLRRGMS